MKVVIVGGYGVFGSLTARLLKRDGHDLWLAGRSPHKARAVASELGASVLGLDMQKNPEALFGPEPDVVIDAAGPFQTYGDDPYRLPRLCIAHGCHYLDLSDASAFTRGIDHLNDDAHAADVFVLSGASSVPGLSSIVAHDLAEGLEDIRLIDIAILPGNRAPRGVSVIRSITSGVGRSSKALRGGQWRIMRGWTDRRVYELAPGMKRAGYFVDVPDVRLLPETMPTRGVMFRAGMELGVMNRSLALLAAARRRWRLDLPEVAISALHWLSKALFPFGSDRGGMQVSVVGHLDKKTVRRVWTLVAEDGDGPFVPGIVCRALLRRADRVRRGARACLAEVPRGDVEKAMSDLAITTHTFEERYPALFEAALGDRWAEVPSEVQELHTIHDVESFSGKAEVTRGRSLLARLAAFVFGFPHANPSSDLTLTKTRVGHGEIWERTFDEKVFRSFCSPAPKPHRYRERFGPFTFEQDLPVLDGAMHLPVRRGWFLGIPLPKVMLPKSDSREFARDGVFHFDVALSAPLGGGLIVRYRGSLRPVAAATHALP